MDATASTSTIEQGFASGAEIPIGASLHARIAQRGDADFHRFGELVLRPFVTRQPRFQASQCVVEVVSIVSCSSRSFARGSSKRSLRFGGENAHVHVAMTTRHGVFDTSLLFVSFSPN
eukprot:jgi/Pico_ML_1/56112/g1702.t1